MSVPRGSLVVAGGRRMLVVSGGMFNSIPDEDGIITITVVKAPPALLTVSLDDGWVAVPGRIHTIPKNSITETVGHVGVQTLTDIDNVLFKILATE